MRRLLLFEAMCRSTGARKRQFELTLAVYPTVMLRLRTSNKYRRFGKSPQPRDCARRCATERYAKWGLCGSKRPLMGRCSVLTLTYSLCSHKSLISIPSFGWSIDFRLLHFTLPAVAVLRVRHPQDGPRNAMVVGRTRRR